MTNPGAKTIWFNALDYQVAERVAAVDYTFAIKKTPPDVPFMAELKIEVRKPDELDDEIQYWQEEFQDIEHAEATFIPNGQKHTPKYIRFILVESVRAS